MPWLRRFAVGVSPRRTRLNSGVILLGLVEGEVALGQDFIRVLRIFLVTLVLPILHSHPLIWHRCYKCNLSK